MELSHMSRDTIDFGIDLGTTNSVIAVSEGDGIEVIKNGLHSITPSMIMIDKRESRDPSASPQRRRSEA